MSGFTNILVHIDSQAESHLVLDLAVDLAKKDNAHLTLVDVTPAFSWPARLVLGGHERVLENVTQSKTRWLTELASPLKRQGLDVATKVVDAPTSVGIIREVLHGGYDLVIKAAKGRASRRKNFFGTTAQRLLRKCPCPILILSPDGGGRCEHVVAAVNTTHTDELHDRLNSRILDLAGEMSRDGHPDVISVWNVRGESILRDHVKAEEIEALQERMRSHAERQLDTLVKPLRLPVQKQHLLQGDPGEVIPQFIRDRNSDLLVMGTIGRSVIAGLLIGSAAETILERVRCSVLAIKPEGFVSPIKPRDRDTETASLEG